MRTEPKTSELKPAPSSGNAELKPGSRPDDLKLKPKPSLAHRLLGALEVPLLLAVPLAMGACAWLRVEDAALLTMAVALLAVTIMFAGWESGKPALRQVMPTVVLASLAAAGRILFAPFPNFKPVLAICIIAGAAFGKRSGFMVGALAALISNMFFGQGPWTPWQMYAWGLVGYLAGVLASAGLFGAPDEHGRQSKAATAVLLGFGFLSGLFSGFILNSWYIVGFVNPITWPSAMAAYAAGLPLDLVHSSATVVFLSALYLPWRRKLARIQAKYDLH